MYHASGRLSEFNYSWTFFELGEAVHRAPQSSILDFQLGHPFSGGRTSSAEDARCFSPPIRF